ncbi:hypothetical protein ABBQ38_007231 [Trebouxia sp. C0009 RCD-2024]
MSSGAKYYDHHDILAGETAIPCTLMTQVNACGRALDQSSEHSNLKKGHGLDLPLWLATDVAARNMVAVRLPPCYGKKMREKMRAGPGCEDLKVRSPYFYSVALGLQPHLYSNDTLAPFVIKSFKDRYQELLSKAHTSDTGVEATRVQSLICVEEQCLFEAGRVSMKATEDWRYKVSSRPSRAGVKRRLDATDVAH